MNNPRLTKGSEIFADIGLSKADRDSYDLAFTVSKMIHNSGLSQRDVATRSGWTQAKVSALMNGRLDGISVGKIVEVAQALGYVAKVTFEPLDDGGNKAEEPGAYTDKALALAP